MSEKDGGPAFPKLMEIEGTIDGVKHYRTSTVNTGMTLRDYFAAKAMQSLILAYPENSKVNEGWIPLCNFKMIATDAYEMADAMLKAREEKP